MDTVVSVYGRLRSARHQRLQDLAALADGHRAIMRDLLEGAARELQLPPEVKPAIASSPATAQAPAEASPGPIPFTEPSAAPADVTEEARGAAPSPEQLPKSGDKRRQSRPDPVPASKRTRAAAGASSAGLMQLPQSQDNVSAPAKPPPASRRGRKPVEIQTADTVSLPAGNPVPAVRTTRSRSTAVQQQAPAASKQRPTRQRPQAGTPPQQPLSQEPLSTSILSHEEQPGVALTATEPPEEDARAAVTVPPEQVHADAAAAALPLPAPVPQDCPDPDVQPSGDDACKQAGEGPSQSAVGAEAKAAASGAAAQKGRQRKAAARSARSNAPKKRAAATQQQKRAPAPAPEASASPEAGALGPALQAPTPDVPTPQVTAPEAEAPAPDAKTPAPAAAVAASPVQEVNQPQQQESTGAETEAAAEPAEDAPAHAAAGCNDAAAAGAAVSPVPRPSQVKTAPASPLPSPSCAASPGASPMNMSPLKVRAVSFSPMRYAPSPAHPTHQSAAKGSPSPIRQTPQSHVEGPARTPAPEAASRSPEAVPTGQRPLACSPLSATPGADESPGPTVKKPRSEMRWMAQEDSEGEADEGRAGAPAEGHTGSASAQAGPVAADEAGHEDALMGGTAPAQAAPAPAQAGHGVEEAMADPASPSPAQERSAVEAEPVVAAGAAAAASPLHSKAAGRRSSVRSPAVTRSPLPLTAGRGATPSAAAEAQLQQGGAARSSFGGFASLCPSAAPAEAEQADTPGVRLQSPAAPVRAEGQEARGLEGDVQEEAGPEDRQGCSAELCGREGAEGRHSMELGHGVPGSPMDVAAPPPLRPEGDVARDLSFGDGVPPLMSLVADDNGSPDGATVAEGQDEEGGDGALGAIQPAAAAATDAPWGEDSRAVFDLEVQLDSGAVASQQADEVMEPAPKACRSPAGPAFKLASTPPRPGAAAAGPGSKLAGSSNNLVAAVRSFLPAKRMMSPQIAAGRKQVKVRALEAAQASKRAEEAKAAERSRAKEQHLLKLQQAKSGEPDTQPGPPPASPAQSKGVGMGAGGLVKLKAAAFQQRIQDEESRRADEAKKRHDKENEEGMTRQPRPSTLQPAAATAVSDKQPAMPALQLPAPLATSKARKLDTGPQPAGAHPPQAQAQQQPARPDVNDKLKRAELRRKEEEERRRAELEAKQKVKEDRTKAAKQAAAATAAAAAAAAAAGRPEGGRVEQGRQGAAAAGGDSCTAAGAFGGITVPKLLSGAQAAGAQPGGAKSTAGAAGGVGLGPLQPRSTNVPAVSLVVASKKTAGGALPQADKEPASARAGWAGAFAAVTTPGTRRPGQGEVPGTATRLGLAAGCASQQPPMTPAELAEEQRNVQMLVTSPYVNAGCHRTPGLRAGATNQVLSYEISPYRSDSDDDDEPNDADKKPIPDWAQPGALLAQLHKQRLADPDKLFGGLIKTINLDAVFEGSTFVPDPAKASKRRDWRKRGSSGDWIKDRLTWQEEVAYKRSMGMC